MRLLIIEDEADLLRRLAKTLRWEGYAVDTAADGKEGLHKAQEHDYDAILLDAMLPVFDGWELLARLRKTKATPVLMLTARDASEDRVRGLDSGADDYVVKPFDLSELLARVRALIRRGAAATVRATCVNRVAKGLSTPSQISRWTLLAYWFFHWGSTGSGTSAGQPGTALAGRRIL